VISVFRINYRRKVELGDLDYGARLSAGRWHTPTAGQPAVVYTAGSRALAQLERRMHCNGVAPVDMALLRLELDNGAKLLDARDLKLRKDWFESESYSQSFGNRWLASRASLGLWVPSYVERRESNMLLNPTHPQYKTHVRVVVEDIDFHFDPRMF
jgi:RES domain-containing protein